MTGWNTDTLAGTAGAGALTIVEGTSFCVSGPNGDMVPELPHGAFHRDTRMVSRLTLLIDGATVEPLSAMTPHPDRVVMVGRAGHIPGRADTPLLVERDRRIGAGLREQITLRSYSREALTVRVELVLEADFADIFEVKEGRAARRPGAMRESEPGRFAIASSAGGHPGVTVTAEGADVAGDRIRFDVVLEPRGTWSRRVLVTPRDETVDDTIGPDSEAAAIDEPTRRFLAWQSASPTSSLRDDAMERVIRQSQRDLGSLRIFDPANPDRPVVAAGVPWFMALFGRDSLLTSWMALPLDPSLALGTLQTLASLQGTREVASSEEQPGRILHEVRLGATTNLALGGSSVYYGTADATPLYVVVLGELARWGALPDDADDLLEAADRALKWVDEYGDRDGDGFVEYERLNEHGLVNQGWKDSWDGINFADGTLAQAPIALCEVQGYVYAAFIARGTLAWLRGDAEGAEHWSERAAALKRAFNERFWLPERGWFAVALDRDKRPVDACASNMGHCLWSGIVDDDKAAAVAERLLSPEMFSGWGVRTLASGMGAYNPASYHNGSVWPHDNAIIAAGLMRYGFVEEANRIVAGLFEAAAFSGGRLPELFCGFERAQYPEPVSYPASCSPQAWAAATPLSLLRTTLRFDPSMPTRDVWVAPTSLGEFGDIHLRNVPFAGKRISIDTSRRGTKLMGLPTDVRLHHEPSPPAAVPTGRNG
ncbi:glycogen debranching enzyme [Agromyces flavus]|uniref:Glycogen debranching enzyme n=1 Tax=Agromyces flavus TaxID=589382 RepID=A0A1H1ZE41_9MICO|nr:glycogen debranching N-terminal domain-containing protein [Agromyces flavus]MCP2367051.1 glycogen debranching enzyme [Agromyces flavus]GGI46498.1 amylo-alpha-1,6-glucosidase [Agromyces flavus]SDT31984.1 Glycogen debranching enzyme (alpha-1,6-glucosidase) [Agromyces flavus]